MENKDQNDTLLYGVSGDGTVASPPSHDPIIHGPPPGSLTGLSLDDPVSPLPLPSQERQRSQASLFLRFARRLDVILIFLLVTGAIVTFFAVTRKPGENEAPSSNTNASRFGTIALPLDELVSGKSLALGGASNVTINGYMQLNSGLTVTPSVQPTGARAGQIYYDQGTNQLAYFNGQQFVFLTDGQQGVQSLGGATGQLVVGTGLGLAGQQLTNAGVLTVQGQAGNVSFTAGSGIILNGTTLSNDGVISIAPGSANVSVSDDGNGNVTIGMGGAGTGTVTSSGGTAGTIPLFTASQNIEDSIITQSGLTVTISGDLSVVTGGLSLSNALTVSNGGTGANSLAGNGVLIGNGTAAVSSVAAGAADLCLLSTAGAPTWAACPGGAGVTSLNGLTGALNIANAGAAGSTITIDDATTATKGIASFSSTNFSVSGGAVNTIQSINTTATPTFAGVNTNTITPSGALTVGISAQTALLQGSTTTITSNGAGNNIVLNSANTIELQDNTSITGNLAASGDVAVNGGDITSSGALNVTPGGTLTVGVATQTLTLQGGASTSFRATSGANTTIIGFTSPTANTTLNFPALAAGTYTICTTSGNCAGAATTLQSAYDNSTSPEIVLDAARGALTVRDNATPLGANLLEVQSNDGTVTYLAVTSSGLAVTGAATMSGNVNTTSGAIQTNGTSRIDNSGNLINITAVTASGNATFQGGTVTIGTNTQAGSVVLNDGSSNTGTLQVAALGQNSIYIFPDPGVASATVCLSTGNCTGVGGGVTTSGGTTNRLAKFSGAQTIDNATITDDGTNVTTTVDLVIQGGAATLGTTSQTGTIMLHDGSGQTTTVQAGDSSGNLTFILPVNSGTANQCLKQSGTGNQLVWQDCDGGAAGSSATLQTAYNNSANPEIALNSSVGGVSIRDNATPIGGNLFEVQNSAGGTTYFGVSTTGASITGSLATTGNINTSSGVIQTAGTTRIDNSGNLVNIGTVSAGTYNGQTISSSASFTGTVAVAGNTTLTGDLALNGGDLTSTGALNITPGGTLTVGATSQQLVLQGNASTTLSVTGGGFSTTVGFTGVPAGNVVYNFDRTATAGTYDICTSVGNCLDVFNNITGSGTAGTIPVFTTSQELGDSLLSQSGATVTVNGNLNLTTGNQFQVNGAQISSANLSNDANLAKLSASQTFTGNTVAFQNTANSTNAFNVQNQGGGRILTVDTTGGQVALGVGSSLDGRLVFSNVSNNNTVTILPGTPSTNRTITLPNDSGTICLDSGNCAGAGATLQTAYNFSVGGTTPKIKVNSTKGGVDIQDADASIGADLFVVRASNNLGLGSAMFAINSGGEVTLQNSDNSDDAFRLLTMGGTAVLTGDTNNGRIILGQSSTLTGSIVFSHSGSAFTGTVAQGALSADRTYTLPNASGTICLDNGNCSSAGGGVTTSGGTTNRLPVFNGSQTLADAWLLQNSSTLELDNTRNLSLLGGNLSVAGNITATGTYNANTLTSSALQFGAAATASISSAASQALNITSNAAATWSTATGNLVITAQGNLNLGVGGGQNINVGTNNAAHTITIGNQGATGVQSVTIGSSGNAGNTVSIESGSSGSISVGAGATAHTVSIGNNDSAAQTVTLGSFHASSVTGVQGTTVNIGATGLSGSSSTVHIADAFGGTQTVYIGSNNTAASSVAITAGNTGGIYIGATATNNTINIGNNASGVQTVSIGNTNSTSSLTLQGGSGNVTLATSHGNRVQVGSSTTDATAVLLTVDSYNNGTDPTGTDGAIYYNTSTGAFRCRQAGSWVDCITASGGFVSLQNAYTNSTGGTTSEIILQSTQGALDIQDRSTTNGGTLGGNLLNIRATAANDATAGDLLFGIGNTGVATLQNSANSTSAFAVKRTSASGGQTVLGVDTTNSRVGIGTATPGRTLDVAINNATVDAPAFRILQSGTGDSSMEFATSTKSFYAGIDNSDGTFKISSAAANGTTIVGNNVNETGTDNNPGGTSAYLVNTGSTSGSVSSIVMHLESVDATDNLVQASIYADSGGTPGARLGTSAQQIGVANSWNTFSISGVTVTASTDYWLALSSEGATEFSAVSSGGTSAYNLSGGWPAPDPFNADVGNNTYTMSFYMNVVNSAITNTFSASLFEMDDIGAITLQNSLDSTAAFRILNATGTEMFTVNTSANRIDIASNSLYLNNIATVTGTNGIVCINNTTRQVTRTTSGTNCSPSSARYKDNIATLGESMGIEVINALRPVTFTYKEGDGGIQVGLIAEEVEGILPEVVAYDAEGRPDAVNYESIVANLIKAIQQQQIQLDELRQGVLSGALVEITGHLRVGGDTTGTAVIPAGQTSVNVTFSQPYAFTPKITTGTSQFVPVIVTGKTMNSFTIRIQTAQSTDTYVDWTALEPQSD